MMRALIFDFGGVLLRTEDQTPRQELAEKLGIPLGEISYLIFKSSSARQTTLGEITTETHWETVRKSLGLSRDKFSAVQEMFWAGDRLDTSLVDFIRSVRTDYKTGLLSNGWGNVRQYLVDDLKIGDAFDDIVISAEIGIAKPDKRIYEMALKRLDVAPEEAVFIDDFIENIEGAKSVGMKTVLFEDPESTLSELKQMLGLPE